MKNPGGTAITEGPGVKCIRAFHPRAFLKFTIFMSNLETKTLLLSSTGNIFDQLIASRNYGVMRHLENTDYVSDEIINIHTTQNLLHNEQLFLTLRLNPHYTIRGIPDHINPDTIFGLNTSCSIEELRIVTGLSNPIYFGTTKPNSISLNKNILYPSLRSHFPLNSLTELLNHNDLQPKTSLDGHAISTKNHEDTLKQTIKAYHQIAKRHGPSVRIAIVNASDEFGQETIQNPAEIEQALAKLHYPNQLVVIPSVKDAQAIGVAEDHIGEITITTVHKEIQACEPDNLDPKPRSKFAGGDLILAQKTSINDLQAENDSFYKMPIMQGREAILAARQFGVQGLLAAGIIQGHNGRGDHISGLTDYTDRIRGFSPLTVLLYHNLDRINKIAGGVRLAYSPPGEYFSTDQDKRFLLIDKIKKAGFYVNMYHPYLIIFAGVDTDISKDENAQKMNNMRIRIRNQNL